MRYTVGSDKITAQSAQDLVRQMHTLSHTQAESDALWMRDVAQRMLVQSGTAVRTGTAEDFVADLVKAGVVQEGEQ